MYDHATEKARELFPDPSQRLKALELHKFMLERAELAPAGGWNVALATLTLAIVAILVPLAIGLWRWALA